ncbi:MAG: class I SAM-dependent methyltransferase, partial [bacterium]
STPFDNSSQEYLESAIFTEGADLDVITDWMGECSAVLDVGAGTLHTAGRLSACGVSWVAGLDPSLPMLRDGSSRYGSVRPIAGRSEDLPFGRESVEGVVCRYAAHHFSAPERFFREAKRILVPGGTLVLQDLVVEKADDLGDRINGIAELRDPSHGRYRSPSQWRNLVKEAGLVVQEAEHFTLPLNYDDWIERSDPSRDSRRTIRERFDELSASQRRRINLSYTDGEPDSFEYPVMMLRCSL